MKQRPSLQFYPQDFLGSVDVQLMSAEEVGVYCLLLFNCVNNGGRLPNDKQALSRLCRGIIPTDFVLSKFYTDGESLRNKRLDQEIQKRKEFISKMTGVAKKRWSKAKTQSMPSHKEPNANHAPSKQSSSSSISSSIDLSKDKSLVSTGKKEKVFELEDGEYLLASLLFSLILENNPNHKSPDLQAWAAEIDKMIRLDKRSPETIEFLIRWSQQDSFWKANILSTAKLRQQYDQLFVKAKSQWEESQKNKIPEY